MKYSRTAKCEVYGKQEVTASFPREAAAKFKQELQEATLKSNSFPSHLEKAETVCYISEEAEPSLRFRDEEGREYDADGMPIPVADNRDTEQPVNTIFIWGMKSYDDLSPYETANIFTANDIEILFDGEQYTLDVEEIYAFDNEDDRLQYFRTLADEFREYVISIGYTEEETDNLRTCLVFSAYCPTTAFANITPLKAYTLLDLYKKFRLFVIGYEAMARVVYKNE